MGSSTSDILMLVDLVKRYLNFHRTLFYVIGAQIILSRACFLKEGWWNWILISLTHSFLEKFVVWVFTMYISGLLPEWILLCSHVNKVSLCFSFLHQTQSTTISLTLSLWSRTRFQISWLIWPHPFLFLNI